MKICVYGAGAVGGYLGAKLGAAGAEVTLITRGPNLAAIAARGLRLLEGDDELMARPRCLGEGAALGPQDYVITTVKAHSGPAAAAAMAPLLGPESAVVPALNGIPWWYFHGLEGAWRDHRLASVDPGGRQWREIGPARAIGCVVQGAFEAVEPGVVRCRGGARLELGEPDGSNSPRLEKLCRVLEAAGIEAEPQSDIRQRLWAKLWGNLAFNPLSVLTQATVGGLAGDPGVRAVARAMMVEGRAVAEALGVDFAIDVDERIRLAAAVGAHKTSMLQDLEQGRRLEIDALTGAVAELGRLTGVSTPTIDMVYALVVRRAREAGCYPPE
jgi:2-dehydropantoate 2-reductase